MTAIDLLTSSDVRVLYGDADSIVDLTPTRPFESLTVAGGGSNATLSPVSAASAEVIPVSSQHTVSAKGFAGDTLDKTATVDGDAMVAVILAASDRGWVIPAEIFDNPKDDAAATYTVTDVTKVDVMWDNQDRGFIIEDVVPLTQNGNVAVTVGAGQSVIFALTTAGSIKSAARKVGIYPVSSISGSIAVSSARGYILVVRPDIAGGVK